MTTNNPIILAKISELNQNKVIVLSLKIKAGAKTNTILAEPLETTVKINLTAPATENAANLALKKMLAKVFKTKKIEIISGHRSSNKLIRISL